MPARPTPSSLTVNCATTNLSTIRTIRQQTQCSAVVVLSNGNPQDQTATAQWSSSSFAVASVSPAGGVTALSAGTTTIKATFQNLSGTQTVTVNVAPIAAVIARFPSLGSGGLVVALQDVAEVTFDVGEARGVVCRIESSMATA
jgi:uncharacterized protein YjdB